MKAFDEDVIDSLLLLIKKASSEIMAVYQSLQASQIAYKPDFSPVTIADETSNQILRAGLLQLFPDIPVISEETTPHPFEQRRTWRYYWLVDPLDGTKEFIEKTDEFAINVALIEDGLPIFGFIYEPVKLRGMYAFKGEGVFEIDEQGKRPLHQKLHHPEDFKIIVSRRHNPLRLDKIIEQLKLPTTPHIIFQGSSLKMCSVARGEADIYPRLGKTFHWDTAAGQVIIEEAHGALVDLTSLPLRYNLEPSLLNPHFVMVSNTALLSYVPLIKQAVDNFVDKKAI